MMATITMGDTNVVELGSRRALRRLRALKEAKLRHPSHGAWHTERSAVGNGEPCLVLQFRR